VAGDPVNAIQNWRTRDLRAVEISAQREGNTGSHCRQEFIDVRGNPPWAVRLHKRPVGRSVVSLHLSGYFRVRRMRRSGRPQFLKQLVRDRACFNWGGFHSRNTRKTSIADAA